MNTRTRTVALRRQHLLAESEAHRTDLALQVQPLMHSLDAANIAWRIAGRVARHPGWIAAATVGVILMKPRRLSALLQAGTGGLRGWRLIAPALQTLLTRR